MSYRDRKDPRIEMIANDLINGKRVGVKGLEVDYILKGLANKGIEVEVDEEPDCNYFKLADNG